MSLLDSGNTEDEQPIVRNEQDAVMEIENKEALKMILVELKKLNTYMHIITGEKL